MTGSRIGLIFHGIGTPGRALERGEERYWISKDHFTTVLDVLAGDPARYYVSFDDGNRSDALIALPQLQARGLKADFFVLTGRIGQRGSLGPEEIRALDAAGMGVGSHGIAHIDWKLASDALLAEELLTSRQALAGLLRREIGSAAIPFGSYDGRTLRALRQAGYSEVYSSDGGWMEEPSWPRPRASIRSGMSAAEQARILAGDLSIGQRLRRQLSKFTRNF